jgi:WD40 repeat protein
MNLQENDFDKFVESRATVLITGFTGAGKTSLLQCVFGQSLVPDEKIGHAESTTQGFDKYEDRDIRVYDSRGLEHGREKNFDREIDDFMKKLRRDDRNVDEHIHIVWYCIDGTRARVQDYDFQLIKKIWRHTLVIITKSDITKANQFNSILSELIKNGISKNRIMQFTNSNSQQSEIDRLIECTMREFPLARRTALRACMKLRVLKSWEDHIQRVWSVAFSPSGNLISSAGKDNKVVVRHLDTQKKVLNKWEYKTSNDVNCVRFSPDGRLIAYCGDDKLIHIHVPEDKGNKKEVIVNLGSRCWSIAFQPHNQMLAVGVKDNKAILYMYIKGGAAKQRIKKLHSFKTENDVNAVVFSSDGKYFLFVDDDGNLYQAEISPPWRYRHWNVSKDWIRSIDVHPSKPIVVVGGEDNYIRVIRFNGTDHEVVGTLKRADEIWCVRFSPCGELIVFGDGDGRLGVWDWEIDKMFADRDNGAKNDHVYAVDVSRDGKYIATGSWDNCVRLWPLPESGWVILESN